MAAPIKPALSLAYGRESWGFAPAVANPGAPALTELNAAAGLNLSCMLFGEQEGATADTEKVTLPRLLCETQQFQANGSTTWTMADLQVSFDPQAAASASGKKAWTTLLNGTSGYLWRRQGIDATTDLVTGQFVDLFPVSIGQRVPGKTGTGADGVFSSTHPISITGAPTLNVAVV
jgi:hypothetical protein